MRDSNIRAHARSPEIGRLLDRYDAIIARGDRPELAAFDPSNLVDYRDNLSVLVPDADEDFRYTYFGSQIAALTGRDLTGHLTSSLEPRVAGFLRECYARAHQSQRPLYAINRSALAAKIHLWERIVLPVVDADGRPALVAYTKPREYWDDLLTTMTDASPDGILALTPVWSDDRHLTDAIIVTANRRMAEIIGRRPDAVDEARLNDTIAEPLKSAIWAGLEATVADQVIRQAEIQAERADGSGQWLRATFAPFRDGLLVTVSDITDLKLINQELERHQDELRRANAELERQTERHRETAAQAEAALAALTVEVEARTKLEGELRRLALTDSLTGLANRHAMFGSASRAVAALHRYGVALSVIIADIDHFKTINDTHGHGGGDRVLREIGRLLAAATRSDVDIAARMGGEEFALLLPHTDLAGAATVAERLRVDIAKAEHQLAGVIAKATASFGVAQLIHGETFETLLSRADQALYKAKRAGRNRVAIAESQPAPARQHKPV